MTPSKFGILDGMIFHLHREALHGRIERGALRHGPGEKYAAPFQTKIIMQVRGHVFLHNVSKRLFPLMLGFVRTRRLRCCIEPALLPVIT